MPLTVTPEAVSAIRTLANNVLELHSELLTQASLLPIMFESNKGGLGYHSNHIAKLVEDLLQEAHSNKKVKLLVKRLKTSADIRETHITGTFPSSSSAEPTEGSAYIAGVLGRIYASGYRKMRTPSSNGIWHDNLFIPDPNYRPTKYNPNNRTFGQIVQSLKEDYGICYTGTPFIEGCADFSEIALAQIGLEDIAAEHDESFLPNADQLDFGEVFSSRNQNFCFADQIAASKQLPILGLRFGYSASDLAQWRKINHFTWDESYINGYLLVPSEIHNNISHTGLVGISGHGAQAENSIAKQWMQTTSIADDF